MQLSRIKDPALAAQVTAEELAWYDYVSPLTAHYTRLLAGRDYRGKKLAYWGHILLENTIPMIKACQS